MKKRNWGKNSIKGINVQGLSTVLLILGIIMFSLIILFNINTTTRYQSVVSTSERYLNINVNVYSMQKSSDTMTTQVRQAVASSLKSQYIIDYFTEYDSENCETCVENLRLLLDDGYGSEAIAYINSAYSKIKSINQREIHAMRLSAYAAGIRESFLPGSLKEYDLDTSELSMTKDEMQALAYTLVYDSEYMALRSSIDDDIDSANQLIDSYMTSALSESQKSYHVATLRLRIAIIIALTIFILIAVGLLGLLLMPIHRCINSISEDVLMNPGPSYEINYLVATYNDLYEKNKNAKLYLKDKAEHDALTGLFNRTAFDGLADFFADVKQPFALMVIDIDRFKDINDTFGHNIGDAALKYVADMLKKTFRSNDYLVRYGGDEFVVLMTDITFSDREIIGQKIESINGILNHPDKNDFPAFTISVGVSFSSSGFHDHLFEEADYALYKSKKNGRGCLTFFESVR